MTDTEFLEAWSDEDEDLGSALSTHYCEHFNRWCWVEIADEATRLLGLALGFRIERDSRGDELSKAACSAAHHGALKTVAAALGVDPDALWEALEPWSQEQDNLPPPVGFDGLRRFVCSDDKSALFDFLKLHRR